MSLIERVTYPIVCGAIEVLNKGLYLISLLFLGRLKPYFLRAYKRADIRVNVDKKDQRPGDLTIHNDKFFARVAGYRSLGVGEAYMDGWWDCTDLVVYANKMFKRKSFKKLYTPFFRFLNDVQYGWFNLQTPQKSWEVGEKHYDIGNELYEKMLDKNMNYSCGYWKNAKNLDEAQINKMDLIAKKLQLKPGMKVLDIGCGWGSLCKYLSEKYGVKMVGCTISVEQAKLARERCAGLPVDIRVVDYRDIDEKFDRIVSVGMFEHVGPSNYRTYFQSVNKCLKDDGIFLLHTISINKSEVVHTEPFFATYIFPNGYLPDMKEVVHAFDDLFIMEDWQNMGFHYSKTLEAWLENFKTHWPELKQNFNDNERFYRMWTFYISVCVAAFQTRMFQLWQIVLTKDGLEGGYDSPR